ncbi:MULTISPECIES: hypothetical protein [Methylobacterium]|nr:MULTISPECIES: hypothetical protein [Methylobacterium]PIU07849.1 MAG: hypothetical protein COT56_03610 [Methylobacterium sp. CG09_land_8_20_14_0_10_71_15]PIU11048.1 MAG: hypothetical protein COT28_21905 [Methylobacterium sp. CG08_land_8_20_14_0_20_71_15]GBU16009.1 hypothetical protein AwMethylo_02240 [Methylobacterium sp.]
MGCVSGAADNVVPFRRAGAARPAAYPGIAESQIRRRSEQRALMDAVYASGALAVAAGDRDTKLAASRLLVYGFLTVEEVDADGRARRLRPSEAIRAATNHPWRLTKPAYAGSLAVTIPAVDGFLFETAPILA